RHHFEQAIATDANIVAAYVSLARLCIQENRMEEAIAHYEALLKKDPQSLTGHMGIGTLYDQQGDNQKAEASYRKALEIKDDFAPAANNLAWILLKNGGNIDEALGLAQIAKEQMPRNPSVMDTLGWLYYLKGSYLNAIAELQDSLALEPDNPVINYHMGMAYFKNGQTDTAKQFLEKALKIDQNFNEAENALRTLEEIDA
ncbi:MAG: tetratricopeptide repeat protein, partial [Deltaproteobacteria bacterium]|nr:tetratricopeptide repeat protein [Deltaproteobacteria bacterium]